MTNVEIVKECYEKFKKGDVAALVAMFDPRIEFRLAEGHPYSRDGKAWVGAEEITREFFMKAGAEWENWDIEIGEIVEANGAVIVEGRYAGVYKPTGRTMDVQVCHIWRLGNGKVTSFHQYLDTARLQKVMGFSAQAAS
jgi:ketosteroid isomerase-like protein